MAGGDSARFVRAVQEARARWDNGAARTAARSSVFSSVTPAPVGKANPWVSGGTGTNAEDPADRILIEPPAGPEVKGRIAGFEPVKIGYLIDIDTGALLGDCLDAVVLAAEDALNDGELYRPVEIVPKIARGSSSLAGGPAHHPRLPGAGRGRVPGHHRPLHHRQRDGPAAGHRAVPRPAGLAQRGQGVPLQVLASTIGNGGVSEEGSTPRLLAGRQRLPPVAW